MPLWQTRSTGLDGRFDQVGCSTGPGSGSPSWPDTDQLGYSRWARAWSPPPRAPTARSPSPCCPPRRWRGPARSRTCRGSWPRCSSSSPPPPAASQSRTEERRESVEERRSARGVCARACLSVIPPDSPRARGPARQYLKSAVNCTPSSCGVAHARSRRPCPRGSRCRPINTARRRPDGGRRPRGGRQRPARGSWRRPCGVGKCAGPPLAWRAGE